MQQATRRQILADMGIVRWRLRAAEVPARQRPPIEAPPAGTTDETAPRAAEVPATAESSQAWSAVSVAAPGVVLLADGASSKRDLRLACDIVAAATADWRQRPVSRRFDWPAADSGFRALNAFVDKDLEDHGARLLVCVETFADALSKTRDRCPCLLIPSLPVLGRNARAKRVLWQSLAEWRS